MTEKDNSLQAVHRISGKGEQVMNISGFIDRFKGSGAQLETFRKNLPPTMESREQPELVREALDMKDMVDTEMAGARGKDEKMLQDFMPGRKGWVNVLPGHFRLPFVNQRDGWPVPIPKPFSEEVKKGMEKEIKLNYDVPSETIIVGKVDQYHKEGWKDIENRYGVERLDDGALLYRGSYRASEPVVNQNNVIRGWNVEEHSTELVVDAKTGAILQLQKVEHDRGQRLQIISTYDPATNKVDREEHPF